MVPILSDLDKLADAGYYKDGSQPARALYLLKQLYSKGEPESKHWVDLVEMLEAVNTKLNLEVIVLERCRENWAELLESLGELDLSDKSFIPSACHDIYALLRNMEEVLEMSGTPFHPVEQQAVMKQHLETMVVAAQLVARVPEGSA